MKHIPSRLKSITARSKQSLSTEGVLTFSKRAIKKIYYKKYPHKKRSTMKDILFINGCALPHPARYRVEHQSEQLRSCGMTVDTVYFENLHVGLLKYYRAFVFFRCPVTPTVSEFISAAKSFNKVCFFDIDDLVIDTKYTNKVAYVKNMSKSEKELYDGGVNRMKQTLLECDYAITTTECLKNELSKYSADVYVNRNVASDEMVYVAKKALENIQKDTTKVTIGYFSGSITHNEDFALVMPSLVKIMSKYPEVVVKVAGLLDIPDELTAFEDRIIKVEFMDWRLMPVEIAACDINIAPLTATIFNKAKSENKWLEAALVKVPTIASKVGAFEQVILSGKTGILAEDNNWYSALEDLILNPQKRVDMAEAAHADVIANKISVHSGQGLARFIQSKLSRNIAFVLPTTDISGGVNVVLRHASILQRRGWDVSIFDLIDKASLKNSRKQYAYRTEIPGYNVLTLCSTKVNAHFDTMVATLWSTLKYVKSYSNVRHKLYLVQGFETDFYEDGAGELRLLANSTYHDSTGVRYITISAWCQRWLKDTFGKESKYAPNGIDLSNYPFRKRDLSGRVKILIEGDSRSPQKNTDEAFRIVAELDPNKFEVSYLSYRKDPKDWYRVDHFYNRVDPELVGKVYAGCDILLKTSLLESFSYPPLEMMATGGFNVVLPNEGNVEYLVDGTNCLFYDKGDTQGAVNKINVLVNDGQVREKLALNGRDTAVKYDWKNAEGAIAKLYD